MRWRRVTARKRRMRDKEKNATVGEIYILQQVQQRWRKGWYRKEREGEDTSKITFHKEQTTDKRTS